MNDADDFQNLWQSQPVERTRTISAPQFGLLEDQAIPVSMPLSAGRRLGYVIGFAGMAATYWHRGWAEGWTQLVAVWLAVAVGIAGIVAVLWQRDRSRVPKPEDSIQSYRTALAGEFERQLRAEWRVILLLAIDWIGADLLWSWPHAFHGGAVLGALTVLLFPVILVFVGARYYRRAANAVRSRLKTDAELP